MNRSYRFRSTISAVVVAAITLLCSLNGTARADDFLWQQDPETGLMIAQLTESTPDNTDHYALYYHQDSLDGQGRYLIYRTIQANAAGTGLVNETRSFWRLDLETGHRIEVMPVGLAGDAVVHGNQIFLYHRAAAGTPVNRISVMDMGTLEYTELANVGNTALAGAIAVNADATLLMYQTTNDRVELLDLIDPTQPTSQTVLIGSTADYQHIQFSPTDPELFTFILQGNPVGLQRVHIGRAARDAGGTPVITHQALHPANSTDPIDSYELPHPFWGIDGRFWTDAIDSIAGHPNALVPLQMNTDPNGKFAEVSASPLLTIQDDEWQLHMSTSRALNWFAGDGSGNNMTTNDLGEPFIHLLRLDDTGCLPLVSSSACGSVEQLQLSSSLGADAQHGGNWEANSRTLKTLDGVVFSAPWDFATNQATPVVVTSPHPNRARNLFMIKLPSRLKARLAQDRVDNTVAGPWKVGHRVTVDAGIWNVDYGSSTSFGDGIGDDTVTGTVGDRYTLADLNGDDVEDRVTFLRDSTGAWTTEVAHSTYDGRLGLGINSQRNDPATADWLVLDDLDGNGFDDLVRVIPDAAGVTWQGFLNHAAQLPTATSPSPGYAGSTFGDSTWTEHAFLADVNGDGYADRIVVERAADTWYWKVDYSLATGFGDGIVDSEMPYFGYPSLDIPLVNDVNGDGLADLVMLRSFGTPQWIAMLSDASGFGASGTFWFKSGFGSATMVPLIGHFSRFPLTGPSR